MTPLPRHRTAAVSLLWAALACSPAAARQVAVNGRTFTVPDGFKVELVAGPPLVDRPIEADFDDRGRLYVSDSSGSNDNVQKQLAEKPHRLLRLEDTTGTGRFDKRTVFADKLMFPEGVMWLAGSVYVAAPPSLWKLTDADGDGTADTRAEWFAGKTLTGCANDLHGPYRGPDGWVYWCKGAFAQQTYHRPGRQPLVTRAAHILRARPDGSGVEAVMTGGMDNPVGVAFTPGGERVFTCTFLQNPAGGRRDGFIHAVYGGVYGKVHDVLDGHPRTSPDVMPVLSHLGPAAPCGVVRYESESFGPAYRDNLFVACFNLHKVTRHVLTPDGATFASRDEDFLVSDGLDFHPTDVLEDADGSLLVIDTGGWYKLCCPTSQIVKPDVLGAIYRVRRVDAARPDDPRGLKLGWGEMAVDTLVGLLDDPRPAVRNRAVSELAARGADALPSVRRVLAGSGSALSHLNATWAATRIDHPAAREIVRSALKDADETVRQAAAHSASVWRDKEAVPGLLELLAGGTPHNRRAAAEALGRTGDGRAVPALLAALGQPADRVLEHSLTYALIELADAPTTAAGLSAADPRARRAALVALDQMEGGELKPAAVTAEWDAPDVALREAAGWVAGRHPEWGGVLAGRLKVRMAAPDSAADERTRLQRQLASLAKGEAIQQLLADRVRNPNAAPVERRLALAAMADAGLKTFPPAWVEALAGALGDADPAVVVAAVATAKRLPPSKTPPPNIGDALAGAAGRADLPAAARLDALTAVTGGLTAVDPEGFAFLSAQLHPDGPAVQRQAAAGVLGKAKLSDEQLAALTEAVRAAGPLEIDRLLGAYERATDGGVGLKLVAALLDSKAAASLRPEAVRPRLAKFGPDVQKAAEPLWAKLAPDAAGQKARLEGLLASLPPGDVRRGQAVFNSQKVACATCHAIGYLGGNVGPDLTKIGQIRSEQDLLESIAFPSASFVRSFEPVMVDTQNGDRHYGIVRKDDADQVELVTGPNAEVRIARGDVKEVRPGTISVMPEGLDKQLAPQELADLVAFLRANR